MLRGRVARINQSAVTIVSYDIACGVLLEVSLFVSRESGDIDISHGAAFIQDVLDTTEASYVKPL